MGDSPAGEARQRTPGGEKAAKRRIVSAGRGRINKAAAMTPRSGANGEGVHFSAEVRPADGGAAKELFGGSGKVGDGSLQSVLDEIEVVTERLGVPDPNLKKKMLPNDIVALLPDLVAAARREHPDFRGQICSAKGFLERVLRIVGLYTSPEVFRRKLRKLDLEQQEAALEATLSGAMDTLNALVAEKLAELDSQVAPGSGDEDFQGAAGGVKWDREMEDLMGEIHTCCMEKPNPIREVRQIYEKIIEWFPSGTIDNKALQKYARKSKMRQPRA